MIVCAAPRVFIWLSDGANLAPNLMSEERSVKIRLPSPKPRSLARRSLGTHMRYQNSPSASSRFSQSPKLGSRKYNRASFHLRSGLMPFFF